MEQQSDLAVYKNGMVIGTLVMRCTKGEAVMIRLGRDPVTRKDIPTTNRWWLVDDALHEYLGSGVMEARPDLTYNYAPGLPAYGPTPILILAVSPGA